MKKLNIKHLQARFQQTMMGFHLLPIDRNIFKKENLIHLNEHFFGIKFC